MNSRRVLALAPAASNAYSRSVFTRNAAQRFFSIGVSGERCASKIPSGRSVFRSRQRSQLLFRILENSEFELATGSL